MKPVIVAAAVGVILLAGPGIALAQSTSRASVASIVVASQPAPRAASSHWERRHAQPRRDYADVTTADMLEDFGIGISAAAAVALLIIGVAEYAETSPTCARRVNRVTCVESTGPRPSSIPAELTWSFVGLLGVGVTMLVTGLVLPRTRSTATPMLSLDAGPTGASIGLAVDF
jgi:hypothetical protein